LSNVAQVRACRGTCGKHVCAGNAKLAIGRRQQAARASGKLWSCQRRWALTGRRWPAMDVETDVVNCREGAEFSGQVVNVNGHFGFAGVQRPIE